MSGLESPAPDTLVTPSRVHLSTSAAERIREMLEEEELLEEGGLRISVRPGAGCSGRPQYNMILETEPRRDDTVLAGSGVRIFLDPTSAWALDGLKVDWVDSPELGSGFAFQHPRNGGGPSC